MLRERQFCAVMVREGKCFFELFSTMFTLSFKTSTTILTGQSYWESIGGVSRLAHITAVPRGAVRRVGEDSAEGDLAGVSVPDPLPFAVFLMKAGELKSFRFRSDHHYFTREFWEQGLSVFLSLGPNAGGEGHWRADFAFLPDGAFKMDPSAAVRKLQFDGNNSVGHLSMYKVIYGTVNSGNFVSFQTQIGFLLKKSFWYSRPFFFSVDVQNGPRF